MPLWIAVVVAVFVAAAIRLAVVLRHPAYTEPESCDAVIALGFSRKVDGLIGARAWELAERYGVNVAAQWCVPMPEGFGFQVFHSPGHEGGAPESVVEFAAWVANLARKMGWRSAIVVTVGCHNWRVARDFAKFGFEVFTDGALANLPSSVLWGPESEWPWCSSPWRYWPRELFARLLPWWFYRWFASRGSHGISARIPFLAPFLRRFGF